MQDVLLYQNIFFIIYIFYFITYLKCISYDLDWRDIVNPKNKPFTA